MWRESGPWQDVVEIPTSVAVTLAAPDGFDLDRPAWTDAYHEVARSET
jgi:hypothetical protein